MRKSLLAALLLVACGDDAPPIAIDLPASDRAVCVALGADYENGVGTLAAVGLPSLSVLEDLIPGAVSGDAVLRVFGRKLYVVNRSVANVTIIDPTTRPWSVEAQFSTGQNSNPQDVALAGDRLYVTRYNAPEVQVWDLSAGTPAAPVASIDLGAQDVDGVPNASSIWIEGGRAYVALGLLDTGTPPRARGKGKVAVIDTATNTLATTLELVHENPFDFMVARGDRLIVSTVPDFFGSAGCLEQIVPGPTPRVEPCLVENSAIMGLIGSIAVGPSETYLAVSRYDVDFKQTAQIRRLDAAGALMPVAMTPPTQIPTDVAYSPTGHLLYRDDAVKALRVIDLATSTEITTAPLDIGLPPAYVNALACLPL
jgi:DNA-binding beta-propeller fold protein YncE